MSSNENDFIHDLLKENDALKKENKRLLEHIEVLKDAIEHLNTTKNELWKCPF